MNTPLSTGLEAKCPIMEVPAGPMGALRVFDLERFAPAVTRHWRVLALSLLLGLGAGIGYGLWLTPSYISSARLWEPQELPLLGKAAFTEDLQNGSGTRTEQLRWLSPCQRALARLQASGSNAVPKGKDGKALPARLTITQLPHSAELAVEAHSADPVYTQAYLDAFIHEYIEDKKKDHKTVPGDMPGLNDEHAQPLKTDQQNADSNRNNDQATLAVLEQASARRSYRQELFGGIIAAFTGLAVGVGVLGVIALRDERFCFAAETTAQVDANPGANRRTHGGAPQRAERSGQRRAAQRAEAAATRQSRGGSGAVRPRLADRKRAVALPTATQKKARVGSVPKKPARRRSGASRQSGGPKRAPKG